MFSKMISLLVFLYLIFQKGVINQKKMIKKLLRVQVNILEIAVEDSLKVTHKGKEIL